MSVKHLDPIFATLAPGRGDMPRTPGREKVDGTAEQGYLHCGPNGAGHFVKMVHNGIEYGMMAAYAEGLGRSQRRQHRQEKPRRSMPKPRRCAIPNIINTISIWPTSPKSGGAAASSRRGCSILPPRRCFRMPKLAKFAGRVSDSGEGRWTIKAAIDEAVPARVLTSALYERFSSRGDADFADKVLSAMRYQFGGHMEKPDAKRAG